jgi:hypothetical protein
VVTTTFQRLYIFVILDIGTRRVVLESHRPPQVGMDDPVVPERSASVWAPIFLVHDRDGIFAPAVDEAVRSMSLRVLKTPSRAAGTRRMDCPLRP